MAQSRAVVGVRGSLPAGKMIPLGIQHLFAMFGSTVLVPYLTGLDTSVALLASGIGTWIYILVTGAQVPSYLGSSFAYIAPLIALSQAYDMPTALAGASFIGLVYFVASALIRYFGTGWIGKLFPPVVIGSVIMVIGFGLAPTAIDMATSDPVTGAYSNTALLVAVIAMGITAGVAVLTRGFLSIIPVLVGVIGGYVVAALLGMVDWAPVANAAWFAWPNFTTPDYGSPYLVPAILGMVPLALVTMTEHLGDTFITSSVIGVKVYEKPGLHRTLLGDGIATSLATFMGGPPNTTYGENIGVLAITKVYSVWVIALAATFAILLSFVQKAGAFIQSIPTPVMGGVTIILFGLIAASGLRTLVDNKVDFSQKRNLVTAAVITVIGIGGAELNVGNFTLSSMALAALMGIAVNGVFALAERRETTAEAGTKPKAPDGPATPEGRSLTT